MGLVDDLEQLALAEVRVRDDQLVHPLARQDRGQVAHGAEHRQAHALRRRSHGADELVVDPAAARAERPVQVREVLAGAGQQRVAARTQQPQHLAGEEVVARPQARDRDRAEQHGRRREPVRREPVPRADREGQRDQRDEEQGREDACEAGAALTLLVEARLREDEHGDEGQKGQPVGLDPPEDSPEHRRAAVVELARHKRRVEAQHEPPEVDADERGDAREPPRGDGQLRPREQKRRAGPDVDRGRRIVSGNRGGNAIPPLLGSPDSHCLPSVAGGGTRRTRASSCRWP